MSTAPNPVKRLVRLEVNGQPVQSAIEPRTVKDLVGDRLVALAGVLDDAGKVRRREQGTRRQFERTRLGQAEGRPSLSALTIQFGMATQFLLDFLKLNSAAIGASCNNCSLDKFDKFIVAHPIIVVDRPLNDLG